MEPLRPRYVIAGVLVAIVCVGGVAFAYHPGPVGLDSAMFDWMTRHRTPTTTSVVSAITSVFGPLLVAIWTVLAAGVLALRDRSLVRAVPVMLGVAAAGLVSEVLKLAVGRARPSPAQQLSTIETGLSYPSGHVTGTAALVMTTALVATAHVRRRFVRGGVVTGAVIIIVVCALTRLYLGVHWTSDVIAGAAVGTAAAIAVPALFERYLPQLESHAPQRMRQLLRSHPEISAGRRKVLTP